MIAGDFAFVSGLAGLVCAGLLWLAIIINI